MPAPNMPSMGSTRLSGSSVWKCKVCNKKYQTKNQARLHEYRVHGVEYAE